jgi:serine/threonine protein kinase
LLSAGKRRKESSRILERRNFVLSSEQSADPYLGGSCEGGLISPPNENCPFDLKPENIVSFISSSDGIRWKLVDFDSSFEEGSHGDDLWVTGKFMSPEVATFNLLPNLPPLTINWTMDILSLGMVAYFLFTNRTIWDYSVVDPNCETVAEVTQEEIKKIISKERSMGGKEKSFVESCLLVEPSDRLSAAELLKKTLFSTRDSTYNVFKITNESMMSRLDQIQKLVQAFTDRSPPSEVVVTGAE